VVVWRMSPYERRRGGNAPRGGFRGRPGAGNARFAKGLWALGGHGSRVRTRRRAGLRGACIVAKGRRTASGRRVRQHRSFAPWGKARPEKWRAEPRPEPDSGNPTVRDRRGASGNVASWSLISTRRARLISISTQSAQNRFYVSTQTRKTGSRPGGAAFRPASMRSGCQSFPSSALARVARTPGGLGGASAPCQASCESRQPRVPHNEQARGARSGCWRDLLPLPRPSGPAGCDQHANRHERSEDTWPRSPSVELNDRAARLRRRSGTGNPPRDHNATAARHRPRTYPGARRVRPHRDLRWFAFPFVGAETRGFSRGRKRRRDRPARPPHSRVWRTCVW
jgi:hypothetical protein